MYSENLILTSGDIVQKEEWKIKRSNWIDKIIEEAAEDGAVLERPTEVSEPDEVVTPTSESTQEKTSSRIGNMYLNAITI